jgi:hypothetical protein
MGHDYLVEYWDEFTPEELDEALGAVLMTLTFFSSASLARAYHEEGKAGTSLAQLAGTVLDIFHDALGEYAHLGRAIYPRVRKHHRGISWAGASSRRYSARLRPVSSPFTPSPLRRIDLHPLATPSNPSDRRARA